jgi:hypothetical protein
MAGNVGLGWEAYAEAYERLGSYHKVAKELGVNESTVRRSLKRRANLDPGIQAALEDTGISPDTARFGYRRIKHEDGSFNTVMWKLDDTDTPEDVAERIATRMESLPAIPAIHRPKVASADLMNFLPIFDVHMGMKIGSYGTAEAVDRLKEGTRDVIDRAPPAETIIIVVGGDYTEANDNDALTPRSKHPLAVDMDFDSLSDVAVDAQVDLIEYALTKAERVIYQPLKGNHDPAMAVALRQAMRQRYRENPRFEIKDGLKLFTHEWGGNLLAAIHGDEKVTKPEDLTLAIAARHAAAWGTATHREFFRGHLHRERMVSVPGMTLHTLNPICPAGRYANDNLFTGQSDIQCNTYGRGGGRKASTVHIF